METTLNVRLRTHETSTRVTAEAHNLGYLYLHQTNPHNEERIDTILLDEEEEDHLCELLLARNIQRCKESPRGR